MSFIKRRMRLLMIVAAGILLVVSQPVLFYLHDHVFGSSSSAGGQPDPGQTSIRGRSVPRARVTASQQGNQVALDTADDDGNFYMHLADGVYDLRAAAPDYRIPDQRISVSGGKLSPPDAAIMLPHSKNSRLISDFSRGAGAEWVKKDGQSIVDDQSTFPRDQQTVKMTSSNGAATFMDKSIFLDISGDDTIYVNFHVDDISKLAEWRVMFGSEDWGWANYYSYSGIPAHTSDSWNGGPPTLIDGNVRLTLRKDQFGATGNPDWSKIKKVRVRVNSDPGATVNVSWAELSQESNDLSKAIVSFVFDDGWNTQFTVAKPKLDEYGWKATIGPIGASVGDGTTSVSLENLKEMKADGWDIANHTWSHADLSKLSYDEAESEVGKESDWLTDAGLGGTDLFLYPEGAISPSSYQAVRKYYTFARRVNNVPGEQTSQFFPQPLALRATPVLNTASLTDIEAKVDTAAREHSVLILVFHKLESPADEGIKWQPQDFAALVDYIATRHMADTEVLNFSDTVKRQQQSITAVAP